MSDSNDVRPLMAYIEKVDAEVKRLKGELAAERAAPEPDAVTLRRLVEDAACTTDVLFAGLIELRDRLKAEEASEDATRKARAMAGKCMELGNALRGALS